ncbi:MAG: septal ring lytic transglycosylase RlpA family protein [Hyphomicrobiales bacterium]|nr:septal ring lytic transglycosylase RlpA family protein [Hyphomicrobiales bacterium]
MSVSRPDRALLTAKHGWFGAAAAALAAALPGCATQTAQHYPHGHEYFSQARYGHASPKVVADGEPVPKGGGQYLVGHPYSVAGHTYYPTEMTSYTAVGLASWYGAAFHGRRTANGEVYDMGSVTAAHPTMPLPSYARVTNLENGYSIVVRVNDRGPYHGGRVMDVSSRTADVLGFKGAGTARIKVDYVGPAPLEGSDDGTLLASLRTDGAPASLNGYGAPVMVASSGPSLFAGLFGGGRSAPQAAPLAPEPPPEPIRIATAEPQAAPQRAFALEPPEPIRVAAAPEEPPPKPAPIAAALRRPREPAPLPPQRPFDLGSIRSSSVLALAVPPAERSRRPAPALPPRRPVVQANAEKALYFSDPALEPRGGAPDALLRLKPVKNAASGHWSKPKANP